MAQHNGGGDASASLTVVANRLPVEVTVDGHTTVSPGGLVSALSAVLGEGDRWVGWPGAGHLPDEHRELDGVSLHPVPLTAFEMRQYYGGFANSVLWPLFHGRLREVELNRTWWRAYRAVNQRFADVVIESTPFGGTVWLHDYHLLLVPRMIRRRRPDLRIGSFLHIPFPNAQLFSTLPWRKELLHGMFGADLVGMQLSEDVDNFLAAAERCTDVAVRDRSIVMRGRSVSVGEFPISIDFEHWDALGASVADSATSMRQQLSAAVVLLGVDRLDYTKGIVQRVEAFGELLDDHRLDPARCVFVQVAVPSRSDLPAYRDERDDVEAAISRVNARHPRGDGLPVVRYLHVGLDEAELATWYRTVDILVVTSLADGMNLVAKEFVAARGDGRAAVVLSEFAGSSHDLADGAVIVNPYDIEAIKQGIMEAVGLSDQVMAARMDAMRAVVRRHDVRGWAEEFLQRLDEVRPHERRSAS
jgi:alpha,alpha-trehalose-phosphate synthase [UDP-forming]